MLIHQPSSPQYIIGNNGHVDTSTTSPQYIIGNNGHVDTSTTSPQYIIGNNGHVDTQASSSQYISSISLKMLNKKNWVNSCTITMLMKFNKSSIPGVLLPDFRLKLKAKCQILASMVSLIRK